MTEAPGATGASGSNKPVGYRGFADSHYAPSLCERDVSCNTPRPTKDRQEPASSTPEKELPSPMATDTTPFPAPAGFRWVCVPQFTHWRSKKVIKAEEHGRKAFCFLVRMKKTN